MQASQLSDQMRLRQLEIENQNLKKQYEEEVTKNNNLLIKVKSIETSQTFAEKYVLCAFFFFPFFLFVCCGCVVRGCCYII